MRIMKNTVPAKKEEIPNNKISAIILAAGIGRRMRASGPKCLLQLSNKMTILDNQIYLLKQSFDIIDIIVVTGFCSEQIFKGVKSSTNNDTRFVFNPHYETTNASYSLMLGLLACTSSKVIVLNGDLLVNRHCFDFDTNESCVVSCGHFEENEIGIANCNNYATNLAYNLPTKWAQITLLTNYELSCTYNILKNHNKPKNLLLYEIINEVITNKGKFKIVHPLGIKMVDVDSLNILEAAKKRGDF